MRGILFRGKTQNCSYQENGKWIYGYYVYNGKHLIVNTTKGSLGFGLEVDEKTIGQFIGLTDKNGKKIFEGDIVKYGNSIFIIVFDRTGWDNGVGLTGFATYNKIYGYEKDTKTSEEFICANRCIDLRELEVIGNIHDNKELLDIGE